MNERAAFLAFLHPHHYASTPRKSPGTCAGGARQPDVANDESLLAEAAAAAGGPGLEEGVEEGHDGCGCCRGRACVEFQVSSLPACRPPPLGLAWQKPAAVPQARAALAPPCSSTYDLTFRRMCQKKQST